MVNKKLSKKLFVARGFAGRVGFGKHSAILVIDLIKGFTEPKSPLAANLGSQLAATTQILDLARKARVPVVFTTVEYDPSLKDAGLFVRKR